MKGLQLRHDGSWQGYLCAVAEAFNLARLQGTLPGVAGPEELAWLFDETRYVAADPERAKALLARIRRKAGGEALDTCFQAFCADTPGREDALARILFRLHREGKRVLDDLGDPDANLVFRAARRAGAQAHLVTGLVRFAELADGSWYAPIEPDCDVLPLVADHFAARFADMYFVIHDRRRGTALLHRPAAGNDQKSWIIVAGFALDHQGALPLSEGEKSARAGWARYFDAVAITERRNPKLQKSHMPMKYWRFLPEMEHTVRQNRES
jgi:probable DNA metabolism protein